MSDKPPLSIPCFWIGLRLSTQLPLPPFALPFVVRDSGRKSEQFTQTEGLRQGCPLSPYLFLFCADPSVSYSRRTLCFTIWGNTRCFFTLEYADDTVLLSNSADQLTRLLHLVQEEGRIRGLTLNEDKCEHMSLNTTRRIYYQPSTSTPCPASSAQAINRCPWVRRWRLCG